MINEYPYLIGYERGQAVHIVNSVENIAAFFVKNNLEDTRICSPQNQTIISSYGPFIDRCTDMPFLKNHLEPCLISYQMNPSKTPAVEYIKNTRNSGLSR